ncbi:hypothetical protein AAG570_008672 [Ranatra chinensis]|uniref:Uncharacterized protein n=1 Tax=Ranatra chinensis TaxID=642074 RepID=A0ABD0YRL4_9HEMI
MALVAAASAGIQQYDHEAYGIQANAIDDGSYASYYDHGDYEAPAHYSFEYSVNDPYTGDVKNQQESRQGDQVVGQYSLQEPDGTTRMVHYTADKYNGFKATVIRGGKITTYPSQDGHY